MSGIGGFLYFGKAHFNFGILGGIVCKFVFGDGKSVCIVRGIFFGSGDNSDRVCNEVYDKKSYAYYNRYDTCSALPIAPYCKKKIGCKQCCHEKHKADTERFPEMAVKNGFFEEFLFGLILVFKKYGHKKQLL